MRNRSQRRGLPRQVAEWYGKIAIVLLLLAVVPFLLLVLEIGSSTFAVASGLSLGVVAAAFLVSLLSKSKFLYELIRDL
jgi:uncharacterized membrane protein